MGKKLFSVAIGNPPYQGANHMQLYPDFYLQAQEVAKCVDLIFPTGWQEPKKANNLGKLNTKEVKEDRQIMCIDNLHNVFPDVPSVEWANVIIWKEGYDNGLDGKQRILTNGKDEKIVRLPLEADNRHVTPEMASVIEKTHGHKNFVPLSSIVLRSESYRFTDKMHRDFPEVEPLLSKGHKYDLKSSVLLKLNGIVFFDAPQTKNQEYIKILGLQKSARVNKYILSEYIQPSEDFYKYKLFVAEAAASGDFGGKLSNMIIAEPGVGHTQTFISIGAYNTKDEAVNTEKYIKTKFARSLLFTLKTTQHNGVGTWANIPLQDFTSSSDIDWSKSIHEIDQQLYAKYGLSEDEINFIETHVKEMA